jgi:hypothetical protein
VDLAEAGRPRAHAARRGATETDGSARIGLERSEYGRGVRQAKQILVDGGRLIGLRGRSALLRRRLGLDLELGLDLGLGVQGRERAQ